MRTIVKFLAGFLVLTLIWLVAWYAMLAGDVARVEASIKHQNERFRARHSFVNLKADSVYPTGFPFRFQIGVDRPTLSMVDGDESYSVSFVRVTLAPIDSARGRYRLELPREVEALYAKSGAAPEHYFVSADVVPQVQVSAEDGIKRCGLGTGQACAPVADDVPLQSFAMGLPKTITLTMTLNGQSRTEPFQLAPMDINVPIYQPIPDDVAWPLELFVRVLREALVYKTPSNTPQ